jgi:two-component system osmolarity sensor histidine kinase EnvZ
MMRRALLKSLLARNIALLIALVMLSQICSLTVLFYYVQRPRVERAAALFGSYIETLDSLSKVAPDQRGGALPLLSPAGANPHKSAASAPVHIRFWSYRRYQRDIFLESLRKQLPGGIEVRWQLADGEERLWIRLHAKPGPYWIALPIPDDARSGPIEAAIFLSLGLAMLAAFTGYLMQRHLNRPLRELARVARGLSAGEVPAPLPTDGPTEIAEVSQAFNQMSAALQQAEKTRAVMLAGISHDIRTPLTKLRLGMAMAPLDRGDESLQAAESYIDQIDAIVQQFLDYAGSGDSEAPEPGDLNALVSRLASDFAGLGHDFELTLGNLPSIRFRPISMMRLLMNLMQNAVIYGQVGLSVRTWFDAGMVYVAVGDRGEGLTAQELEALRAPFQRGRHAHRQSSGTGLGLAIVERITKLHGGSLEFRSREGGGLEVCAVFRGFQ